MNESMTEKRYTKYLLKIAPGICSFVLSISLIWIFLPDNTYFPFDEKKTELKNDEHPEKKQARTRYIGVVKMPEKVETKSRSISSQPDKSNLQENIRSSNKNVQALATRKMTKTEKKKQSNNEPSFHDVDNENKTMPQVTNIENVPVKKEHAAQGMNIARKGAFPNISLDYDRIGFDNYLKFMQHLEAHMIVGKMKGYSHMYPLAEVEMIPGYNNITLGDFSSMSQILKEKRMFPPRQITDEPRLFGILQKASARFAESNMVVAMFVPQEVEAMFIGALDEHFKQKGINLYEFESLEGEYAMNHGVLSVCLTEGYLKTGEKVRLNITLDLSDL
jgi:hypothetical protein